MNSCAGSQTELLEDCVRDAGVSDHYLREDTQEEGESTGQRQKQGTEERNSQSAISIERVIDKTPIALPQPLEEQIGRESGPRTERDPTNGPGAWETVAVVDHPMITIKASWSGGHLRGALNVTPMELPSRTVQNPVSGGG